MSGKNLIQFIADGCNSLDVHEWIPFVLGFAADGCHPLAYGSSLLARGYHSLVKFVLHENSNYF
jgi:hypothetical protein